MSKSNFKNKFDRLVQQARRIIVTTHHNPDPDGICSCLAVYDYLKKTAPKKNIQMIITSQPFNIYNKFKHYQKIKWVEDLAEQLKAADLIIFLDGNQYHRFAEKPELIHEQKAKTVCFDHHPGKPDLFDLELIDLSAAATCQMVADILFDQNHLPEPKIAETLLAGILSDSGNFRWLNAKTVGALKTATRLIKVADIDLQLFLADQDSLTKQELEIIKILLKNTVNTRLPGRPNLTYSFLTKKDVDKFSWDQVSSGYHHFLMMIVRKIKNHPWGFVVIPKPKNQLFKVSLRALPGVTDLGKLAKRNFEGGGQATAAGGQVKTKKDFQNTTSREVCSEVLAILAEVR